MWDDTEVMLKYMMDDGLNKVPADIQNAAPAAIEKAVTVVKSGVEYLRDFKPLKRLETLLSSSLAATAEAKSLIDSIKEKHPEFADKSEHLYAAIQKTEKAGDDLISCVKTSLKSSANKALKTAYAASFVGVVVEAGNIFVVWEEISEGNVLVESGLNQKKAYIQNNIAKIPDEIAKFSDGLDQHNVEKIGDKELLRFYLKKSGQRKKILKKLDGIETEIGKLETTVNGKIEKLSSIRKATIPTAISQTAQGGSQAVNLGLFRNDADKNVVRLTFLAMILHWVVAGWSIFMRHKSGMTIEELRRKLDELDYLRNTLDEQQDDISDEFSNKILVD